MIFEHRSVYDIQDAEIAALVSQRHGERQHIEYKAIYNNRNAEHQLENLRDIASFANSGGGYIFYGIGEDGNGNASGYSRLTSDDAKRTKESISSLCQDHIKQRIEGLEVQVRIVEGNHLVIVRVPDTTKKPHMVTLDRRTDFWYRNHDGKREMDISQIAAAFRGDFTSQQLNVLTSKVDEISQFISSLDSEPRAIQHIDSELSGETLLKRQFETFEAEVEQHG